MNPFTPHPTNELVSALTHLAGFGLAVVGFVFLLQRAGVHGGWSLLSAAVFGVTLTAVYATSTIYHALPVEHHRKALLRRWDQAMIYLVIAGTYTPVTLVPLRGVIGWSVFGIVWFLALTGIVMKIKNWNMNRSVASMTYLVLGWLVLVVMTPLAEAVSWEGFGWLFAGGVLYSIGVVFFALEVRVRPRRWFGMHEIFHLFVMGGSVCHWWFVYKYIAIL